MKALSSSLKYFVVQKLRVSNREAIAHILSGRVQVNGQRGSLNQVLQPEDEVHFEEQIIKVPEAFRYIAWYKPRGIESTLNPEITNNLMAALPLAEGLFPVGRLDKESEGLMLLTDNGKIYNQIIHAESHQEKEYEVTVDKPLTTEAVAQLAAGVTIMGKLTRPAVIKLINANVFTIILTQGLNRQIRRMCYKLGYQVQKLIRTRMLHINLADLKPGEWHYLSPEEVDGLYKCTNKS